MIQVSHILGVDPGAHGAVALLEIATGGLTVEDMPTLAIRKGKTTRRVIDHYALARLIDAWAPLNPQAWVEQVATRPGEGAVGAFSFGKSYGLVLGVLAAHFIKIEHVTPASWKTALKVKGDKDVSRQRASALFPTYSGLWARVRDDGRAEAALIAYYGAQNVG